MKHSFIHGIYTPFHYWQTHAGFMVSDEEHKRLYTFPDLDAAINSLFTAGYKDFARYLNTLKTEAPKWHSQTG